MKNNQLFRRSLFGYKKEDVDAYVKKLEETIENQRIQGTEASDMKVVEEAILELKKLTEEKNLLQQENAELKLEMENSDSQLQQSKAEMQLKQENEELRMELEVLKEYQQKYLEDRKAISQVLSNAKEDAKVVLEQAHKKAKDIIDTAEQSMREKSERMELQLQQVFFQKAVDFVTVKYRLDDYVRDIDIVKKNLGDLVVFLNGISSSIPENISSIIKDGEDKTETLVHETDTDGQSDADVDQAEEKENTIEGAIPVEHLIEKSISLGADDGGASEGRNEQDEKKAC